MSSARAAEPDPWFARDKALHFGACVAIAATGYGIGAATLDGGRYQALVMGGASGIAAGGAKEVLDMAGLGTPSWRDFAWDVAGTVVGVAAAWTLDMAFRGTGPQRPAFGPRQVGAVAIEF